MKLFVVVSIFIAVSAAAVIPTASRSTVQPFQNQPYQQQYRQPYVQPTTKYPVYNDAPKDASRDATILRYESENNLDSNGYHYSVESSDGQVKEEQGTFENAGTKDESLTVVGRFLYRGLDGITYEVKYVADKDGFRPEGDHLPRSVQAISQV